MEAAAPVLCVDDEPQVLAGLSLSLGRRFAVQTATSGAAGLEALGRRPNTAVIVSDMRMPGMDGATFLEDLPGGGARRGPDPPHRPGRPGERHRGRERGEHLPLPHQALPAGQAGGIGGRGGGAGAAAGGDRALLEQTVHGSVRALVEVLAVTSPAAFDRASRLSRLSAELAERIGMGERWQLEAAAMLSQLGAIALPDALARKLHRGEPLDQADERLVEHSRVVAERLLGAIPTLEAVRAILDGHPVAAPRDARDPAAEVERLRRARALLRLVLDYEALEEQGVAPCRAIDTLRGRPGRYDPELLEALSACCGAGAVREEVLELPVIALRAGMVLLEDVKSRAGVLLAVRGQEITSAFAERVHRFGGPVCEPVRVVVRGAAGA